MQPMHTLKNLPKKIRAEFTIDYLNQVKELQ